MGLVWVLIRIWPHTPHLSNNLGIMNMNLLSDNTKKLLLILLDLIIGMIHIYNQRLKNKEFTAEMV